MLFVHEVHQVVGKKEDEFEAAYRDGWMPTPRRGRRRPPALVREPRARKRRLVQRRDHHRRARRRGVGALRAAAAVRRSPGVGARGRHVSPRRDRESAPAGVLVADPGGRLRRRSRSTGPSTSCRCSWRTPAGRPSPVDDYIKMWDELYFQPIARPREGHRHGDASTSRRASRTRTAPACGARRCSGSGSPTRRPCCTC